MNATYWKLLRFLEENVGNKGRPGTAYSSPAAFAQAMETRDGQLYDTLRPLAAVDGETFEEFKENLDADEHIKYSVPRVDTFLHWMESLGVRCLLPQEWAELNGRKFRDVPTLKVVTPEIGPPMVWESFGKTFHFRAEWIDGFQRPALLFMDGTAMHPTLEDGELILIDRGQTDIRAGKMYAVRIEDTLLVRRVEKKPGTLVLLADNTNHAPTEISSDSIGGTVDIVGRVVWAAREF